MAQNTNAVGLANSLLISTRQAFAGAAGIDKISTPGFLQMLLSGDAPRVISAGKDDGSGYIRDVKLRYRTRGIPGVTNTNDDCSVQVRPAYLETIIPATSYRSLGLAFEDDLIAKFQEDALGGVQMGTPGGTVMMDVFMAIIENCNSLFADINNDILGVQAASFGKNVVTGSNAAKTVNFKLDATQNDLTAGMTGVMSDAAANEVRLDGMIAVGNGLVYNYFLQQKAKSADQSGLDTSGLFLPKFYYDQYTGAAWGANQFALFEKNSTQFVNICRFRGAKAGLKGSDYFMTMRLPVTDSLGQASLSAYEFDVQLTYRTCPGELQIGPAGEGNPPVQLGRGWNVIISSSYQLVNQPANSYQATDRLFGVNGAFRYNATNA